MIEMWRAENEKKPMQMIRFPVSCKGAKLVIVFISCTCNVYGIGKPILKVEISSSKN